MVKAGTPSTAGSRPKQIALKQIRLDGDTQSREELNEDVIKEYASLMADGVEFPPLLVVHDGSAYWLYDGFHRRFAAVKAGMEKIKCLVVTGTREDARWLSYGANKDHGLKRENKDKQKAVVSALKHPKGAGKSDRQIAEHVGVSHTMVARHRDGLQATGKICQSDERTGRDGRTINTANIGKKQNIPREPSRVDQLLDAMDEANQRQAEENREEAKEELLDFVTQYADTFDPAELTVESKDAFGNEIKGDLAKVFEIRAALKEQRNKLTSIKTWITQNENHPGAVLVQAAKQRIETDIDNADRELKFAMPHCVCIYCHNKDPKVANCNACKGTGWITESIYKAAPKGMQCGKAKA